MPNALKPKALFVVLATVVALAASPVMAGGGHKHGHGHGHGHGYKHGYKQAYKQGYKHGKKHAHKHAYKHGKKHAYKQGYKHGYKHGYKRPYYNGYRPYYKPYYRPYYRSGGTVFNFAWSAPVQRTYVPAAPVYQPAPVVVQQPSQVVVQPTTNQVVTATAAGTSSCLMTREYQTEIIVGNRIVPGYGDACLQPDGSWLRLPAKPARY